MVIFAAQGDPRRAMALLWRQPPEPGAPTRRGPKPALDVDTIVDAAIAIADADGLAALSMRAVGHRLGRTAMALYTYVPGKGELIDLMYDRTFAELPSDYPLTGGWRAAIGAWANDLWECYLRHPWLSQVSYARPVLGPHEYAALEAITRILHETGLPPSPLWRVVGTLFHFVRAAAGTVAEARQATTATGLSDEQWWHARSAMLAEVAPDFAERFPTLTRLQAGGAFEMRDQTVPYLEQEARETFQVGLAVLLDGVDAAVAKTRETGQTAGQ